MLTDREHETRREIQRWLLVGPDLIRTSHFVEERGAGDHLRPAHHSTVLVTLALTMLLLVGPNLPTDDEVADRQQPPTPQVEWAPAWETQWLFGPTDSDPFRSFVAPVSTPSSAFAPSVAA